MYKRLWLLLIPIFSFAQKDSSLVANASWKTEKLSKGIVWKYVHFQNKELFEANQSVSILEINLRKKRAFQLGIAVADSMEATKKTDRKLTKTSTLALQNNALAAINGGFFDMKNGGAVDFVKVGGVVTDTTRIEKVTRLPAHAISAITIHHNRPQIIQGKKELGWEKGLEQENVLLTGPLLVYNNQRQNLPDSPFNSNRHPRTCACLTTDKKLLLITVDGRSAESYGMSLPELTTLTKALKCKDAINFDGGGSTTMYISGKPENGVVNFPSDNKLFDHAGERKVANIFYVKTKK